MHTKPLIPRVLALAFAYYWLARLGLNLASLPGNISPVWPPTGLAIAVLFLYGRNLAFGVFLGALVVNLHGLPVWAAFGLATGNTLEALVAATLMKRFEMKGNLSRPRDVTILGVAAAGAATLVSAFVGVNTLHLAGIVPWDAMARSISVWWIGDALGALIVAPLLLTWLSPPTHMREASSRLEVLGLSIGFTVAMGLAFLGSRPSAFLVYPVVAWAALRFSSRGATLATAVVAAFAIQRTAAGVGRFVTGDPISDLWVLDAFLAVLALTGLVLAAIVDERDRSQRDLRNTNMELEEHVALRTEALRIDRYRLEQAQRVALIGSWEWDLRTDIVTGSAELDRLYDVERHANGTPYTTYSSQLIHEDRRKADDAVRRAVTHGESFVVECRVVLHDGSLRWLRIHGQPYGPPGQVTLVHGSAQDITETKLAEEAIRASEERTARIVDAASEAFVSINIDGFITDWNAQAETTFGWAREEALGKALIELIVPPSYRHAHSGGVARYLATGHTQVLNTRREIRAIHRDGHEFPVELAVWNTVDVDGVIHFHAFLHDISERLADKAALAEALDEAREASRLKSAFLANMSHEIRTPMNGVLGMVGFLLDTPLDDVQRDYVQTMAKSAETLVAIIDDVLDVSKIEAGKLTIEYGDVNLRRLVQETVSPYTPAASEKGLTLSMAVDESVPAMLRGDRLRLRQVIGNLVSNAVKFTSDGYVAVTVTVDAAAGQLRFQVADSGIGISEEARSHLFEPFMQADASTTRRFGGTGLGLSICHQLVQLMGGEIGVISGSEGGSCFWFTLPLVAAVGIYTDPAALGTGEAGARPRTARRAPNGHRVLVVEDNAINRKVAVGLLEQLGYEVEIAVDGVDALRVFEPGRFDAVLMDCQMPRMDGYDATAAIRAREGDLHTPIVAMTASAMASDRERCLAAGMDDFLSKPVSSAVLESVLTGAMANEVSPEPADRPDVIDVIADFDRSVIDHLRALDEDGTLLHELVMMFRADFGDQLANLRGAIAANNPSAVRGVAHKMKGSTGLLGLTALTEELAVLEHSSDDLSGLGPRITAVQSLFREAVSYLHSCDARVA